MVNYQTKGVSYSDGGNVAILFGLDGSVSRGT